MHLAFVLLSALIVNGSDNKNRAEDWIMFGSRESASGPALVLTVGNQDARTIAAVADTVVISYLADRIWGSLPVLSVDMRDANRSLLRFDFPRDGEVRKAELVLQLDQSPLPPSKPFDLGLYEITEAWNEAEVMWKTQPAFKDAPTLKISVQPKTKELRWDITEVVRRAIESNSSKHGWLLKVADPVTAGVQYADLEGELIKALPWQDSIPQALRAARDQKKLILACVRGSWDPGKPTFSEQLLFATGLADPDVSALVRERFVPVRISYPPSAFTHQSRPQPDPLAELGTTISDTKALALIVSDANGSAVARLTNIGTFDRDLILRFLLNSLVKSGMQPASDDGWKLLERGYLDAAEQRFSNVESRESQYALCRIASLRGDHAAALRLALQLAKSDGLFQHEAKVESATALMRLGRLDEAMAMLREATPGTPGPRSGEAKYYLGCLLYRAGKPDEAAVVWKEVVTNHAGSAFALRAKTRLAWPERMAMYENLVALDLPSDLERTEVNLADRDEMSIVNQAINYLLSVQHADGSWPVANGEQWKAAVTAIVARSLLRWGAELGPERRDQVRTATSRATRWLCQQLEEGDAKTMDSFGAAYMLDYFVDLAQAEAIDRGTVEKAAQYLIDAQCPNGGWSYSYRFGTTWTGGFGGWPRTDKGRVHSINTAPALLALARAKDLGIEVNDAAIDAGRKVLLAMRDGPGVYTYTYPVPISFMKPDQSIARGPVCEEALCRLGGVTKEDLQTAIERFLEFRAPLRLPVKLDESWSHPHAFSSYFFFYAYAHAASAIAYHGESAASRLNLLRQDILSGAELDGTWLDFEVIGKPYGTAMALYVLHLARTTAR